MKYRLKQSYKIKIGKKGAIKSKRKKQSIYKIRLSTDELRSPVQCFTLSVTLCTGYLAQVISSLASAPHPCATRPYPPPPSSPQQGDSK